MAEVADHELNHLLKFAQCVSDYANRSPLTPTRPTIAIDPL